MPDGMTIDSVLKPGVAWRGRDDAGRVVVLKKMPHDCLRGGRLHPAIALRLTRLREAPMNGLANVIGVLEADVGVVIVSEYVAGRSLDDMPLADRSAYVAEARGLVESLHRTGLVHGAVGPGNFVVGVDGRLRLIDPSPLLYDDPAVDLAAVARLDPTERPDVATVGSPGLHRPTLAAAAALSFAAVMAAAAWALHVAGRS